ncbi:MAG TPA: response regulator, partial [Spirochaetota bacterium]|nr:response regulator [Spirochaetota bacterium]
MNKESFVIGTVIDPVLIVEDKKENQDLLFELCKKMNVVSEIASNGKIALDMCANRKFSVYIVDLMMPVMDGRTFISEIKKIDPSAIILVQTALDSSETIIDIMRMGVFDYVIKPIEPELFMSVLLKALEYGSLKQLEMSQTISAGDKIRGQIEWLNYKESRRMMTQDSTES